MKFIKKSDFILVSIMKNFIVLQQYLVDSE